VGGKIRLVSFLNYGAHLVELLDQRVNVWWRQYQNFNFVMQKCIISNSCKSMKEQYSDVYHIVKCQLHYIKLTDKYSCEISHTFL
jgi:hypothetical protein